MSWHSRVECVIERVRRHRQHDGPVAVLAIIFLAPPSQALPSSRGGGHFPDCFAFGPRIALAQPRARRADAKSATPEASILAAGPVHEQGDLSIVPRDSISRSRPIAPVKAALQRVAHDPLDVHRHITVSVHLAHMHTAMAGQQIGKHFSDAGMTDVPCMHQRMHTGRRRSCGPLPACGTCARGPGRRGRPRGRRICGSRSNRPPHRPSWRSSSDDQREAQRGCAAGRRNPCRRAGLASHDAGPFGAVVVASMVVGMGLSPCRLVALVAVRIGPRLLISGESRLPTVLSRAR